jgi:hypothetical protein
VHGVRKIAASLGVWLILLMLALPAAGQAKDPFRPPPGAGTIGGGTTGPGAPVGEVPGEDPQAEPPGNGLPRTGLDYSLPMLAAMGLIAAGASMRLASSALGH